MTRASARRATALVLWTILGTFVTASPGSAQDSAFVISPDPNYALPKGGGEAEKVGSVALVENAKFWDGRTVAFTGEAIGEAFRRGKSAWIHLNDDAYMWKNIEEGAVLGGYNSGQAVWIPAELAARISYFGDYRHDGDVVEVRGVFNAACREHGGDMDIHATELTVIKAGHVVRQSINTGRLLSGLALLAAAAAVAALGRFIRARQL